MMVKDNSFILSKLKIINKAFEEDDSMLLRSESNELIKTAVQEHDKELAKTALIAYCLHKILSKSHFAAHEDWPKHKKNLLMTIKEIRLKSEKDSSYLVKGIDELGKEIQEFDTKFGSYLENLIEKSKIKYAAEAFYLGMSLNKAAEFMDTNFKSLQIYLSKTKQFEETFKEASISKRIEKLEKALR